MRSPELSLGIDETKYVDGKRVTTLKKEKPRKIISDVAKHESLHGVTALLNGTGVVFMTKEPGPGYEGLTLLTKPDHVAAAAPHAHGHEGASWDLMTISASGGNESVASNAARSIVSGNEDKVDAVAELIDEKLTVTGSEAREAIRRVEDKEFDVEIIVEDLATGKREKEEATSKKGIVVFHSKWLENKQDEFELAA